MMNPRIMKIRDEERKYHEVCYEQHKLFEQGSWLNKPVQTVMDILTYFDLKEHLQVLDLGCGVGRNSIPIAESLKDRSGQVVCVDLIESALTKLMEYSRQHGVEQYIKPCCADIGSYEFGEQRFDYIVAVSSLEHVESEEVLRQLCRRMIQATNEEGIHLVIMNTNIREIDQASGQELEVLIELNLPTDAATRMLSEMYNGWKVLYTTIKALEFSIERNGRNILLSGDCLTYVVQKKGR